MLLWQGGALFGISSDFTLSKVSVRFTSSLTLANQKSKTSKKHNEQN